MKKIVFLISAALLMVLAAKPAVAQSEYPDNVKDVAVAYAKAFFSGDKAAAQYVNWDGINVLDMATTPAALEKELFPQELKKNAGKKPTVSFVKSNPGDFDNQTYAVLEVGNNQVFLLLTQVDGKWKVDFSAWYYGTYYDEEY